LTENFQKSLVFKLKISPLGKNFASEKKVEILDTFKGCGGGSKKVTYLFVSQGFISLRNVEKKYLMINFLNEFFLKHRNN